MSETSDDALAAQKQEGLPPPGEGADADDVEVVAQAPEPEPPPAPRHDSVAPTSRKLAPPPKPKRDSSQPASLPPSADGAPALGSLKAPSAPSISFQDANASTRDAVAAALAGSESLRVIGETLAKDAGAFSASETPTGGRPPVPRPRTASSPGGDAPASSAGESTAPPEETPSSAAPAKTPSIFAQRIISVGVPSDRPPPPPEPESPVVVSAPEPQPHAPPQPDSSQPSVSQPSVSQPSVSQPSVSQPSEPSQSSVSQPSEPPQPSELSSPSAPPPIVPPSVVLQSLSQDASDGVSVEVTVEEPPPDIPITTDEDEEDTSPTASPEPLAPPPVVLKPPTIPDEPTPPPPLTASSPSSAPEPENGPDSLDRIPVEELSREDSPSIPPDPPAAPPPAPSARGDVKPPPPPKRAPAPPAAVAEPKKSKTKRAWWEELFGEDFVRANWKVSDEQIKREVTFVEESLGVAPGGVVLDLGCGSGQHAIELASRGYGVVGYDLSLYQLALAADTAQERSQKINFLQGDMREMAFEEMFDGIYCWNTTFGYFEEDKNFSVAERAFRALRPGGMFLIDVMNRDFVAAHTPSSVWFEGDACVCMDDAVIDYFTSRLRVKRSVILDDGRTRECTYSVRLYSFHELGKLLHEVGFRVTEVSGHPATPGVFLGQASPRILMLAQRP